MQNLLLSSFCVLLPISQAAASSDVVWFAKSARHFTESSPLGNGRLGAMLFGGVEEDIVVLNESGMWSGSPQDADRENAHEALPEIRRLLFAGENAAAEQVMNEKFTCAGEGSGYGSAANLPYGCYQTLGKLRLQFHSSEQNANVENYRRELDLKNATARIDYTKDGVDYRREAFVSHPDEVIVYRLTASEPNALSLDISLDRPERSKTTAVGNTELHMSGQLPDGREGESGVRYSARLRAIVENGDVSASDDKLQVRDATSVLILVTAATDLNRLTTTRTEDPAAASQADLNRAAEKAYAALRDAHVADYQQYYDRVTLRLGSTESSGSDLPIGQRLQANWEQEPDADLAVLYFNFGRYLLISSSRPGGRPANLQGIWAEEIQTPWNADWHLNINVQMNYWPAEVCNLSDLHEPLTRLIVSLVEPGTKTAKAYYDAQGWVAHVLANPWGFTSPGEQAGWGSTSTCSAWVCQHLWEHYLFTQDEAFLREFYPILKGSAVFYLNTLVEHPKHGWLVTAPSTSPENSYYTDEGEKARICVGSTMDMQLLRFLFQACYDASRILGEDEELGEKFLEASKRLAPTRIASDGRIMEWDEEYREVDPQHRHVSHLWGLYPGYKIRPSTTPELAAGARKTLEVRGDEGTGWGLANKLAMWSRLRDGEKAHHLLQQHLRPVFHGRRQQRWSGGTYPNLFDAHPPFQIDGNFGATAAIAEMLLQSSPPDLNHQHHVDIHLLPTLPEAWSDGKVTGLCARGGFVLSLEWQEGELNTVEIISRLGLPATVHYGSHQADFQLDRGEKAAFNGKLQMKN